MPLLPLIVLAQAAALPTPLPLHGGSAAMTCPVGGEPFTALQTNSYSTIGARPDGRAYTYWYSPLPLPVCPTNQLVVFDAFSAAEVARLTVVIATPAYRALTARDTTYYRAQWLATRIGRSERDALFLLLPATWQVKPAAGQVGQGMPSPAKARAYQREFVRRVRALGVVTGDMELDALTYRAANAERELGRFGQATALLKALGTRLARADPGGWRPQVAKLAVVIERRDASTEPRDMHP